MIFSDDLLSARVLVPASVVLVFAALALRPRPRRDERNPPYIPSTIPVFGHLINFLLKGPAFWIDLRAQAQLPIYSINFVTQEVYVVNDTDLIGSIQREAASKDSVGRAISQRTPLVDFVFGKLFGHSRQVIAAMKENMDGKLQGEFYRPEMHRLMANGLAATSESAAQVYRNVMISVARDIETMTLGGPTCLDLLQWLRLTFGQAAAAGFHGPENPFAKSPELIQDLWDFDDGRPMVALGILPSILGSSGFRARERCVKAYRQFLKGEHPGCCQHILDIISHDERYGFSEDSHARSQFSMVAGLTSSNVPATFWILALILCHEPVKVKIMDELKAAIMWDKRKSSLTLDLKLLKEKCPLLNAACEEVIRLKSSGSTTLRVEKDYLLDGRHLLNRDALIMIPNIVPLRDTAEWGPDALEFRPERFLDPKRRSSPANRPFGGGYNVCPARHFVKVQMLGFAALVLFSFDLTPGEPGKGFSDPGTQATNITTTNNPVAPFKVRFTPREELKGVRWHVV